jgi:hypothetical protein
MRHFYSIKELLNTTSRGNNLNTEMFDNQEVIQKYTEIILC